MDFTINIYRNLLESLKTKFFNFLPFSNYSEKLVTLEDSSIILRHDVDLMPENSLLTAELEESLGIRGTYYFRIIPETFKPDIIQEISALGHEIGYHYEDMDLVKADNLDCHIDLAFESFKRNLERLRKIAPIKTICMHGSPRAKYDNKLIWTKYNYKELGIIGEPYLDLDFNEFGYLTDTGRRWNGDKVSVRDLVNSKYNFNFRTTKQIIENIDKLPAKIMFTIHPQRWHNSIFPWTRELILQNAKNLVKYTLVKIRN